MHLSTVSVLIVAQSSSEIPEGLMNYPVFAMQGHITSNLKKKKNIKTVIHNFLKLRGPRDCLMKQVKFTYWADEQAVASEGRVLRLWICSHG